MKPKLTQSGLKAVVTPIFWIALMGFAFFIAAGSISIARAWIYIGLYLISSLVSSFILYIKTPDLLNDRGAKKQGTKKADTFLLASYFIFAIIITPIIAGLDYRYKTTLLSNTYLYFGLFLLVISAIITTWAMLSNKFFEGTIRVQTEKEHEVINTGLYKIVRHPGYTGIIIGSLAMPLSLGSLLSFIPCLIAIIIIILRTYYEDISLQKELNNYSKYCQEVKYRLVPFIW
ncbi:MAG: isoprenylcysteine carboxylmethyltransferase family protein [Bacteroidales bacterium]|nr:isoprenylcysteine carboxylmethyltransferase family protein [Bacteroidales bacterium]